MSLPRRSRLSGQAAFSNVFRQAVVSTDASFKVLAQRTDLRESRLGMAVSRQVDKRAVERNRLKRIIRESFRRHYLPPAGRSAVDIVVLPRQQAVSVGNRELYEQLARHWQRIDERILKTLHRADAPQPDRVARQEPQQ